MIAPTAFGWSLQSFSSARPSSKPGRIHGSHSSSVPKTSRMTSGPRTDAAIAMSAFGCVWSTCARGTKAWSGVSIEVARGLRFHVQWR